MWRSVNSSFSCHTRYSGRMKRLLTALASVMVLLVAFSGSANASVPEAFCNGNGPGSCANRYQGGNSDTTPVILWNHDLDGNEDFAPAAVLICNNGLVSSSCPFTDHSIDAFYLGRPIVQLVGYDHSGPKCIGADPNSETAFLTECSNTTTGAGGGFGELLVQSSTNYYVDRGLTNQDGARRWMCGGGFGSSINMGSTVGTPSTCQWAEKTS